MIQQCSNLKNLVGVNVLFSFLSIFLWVDLHNELLTLSSIHVTFFEFLQDKCNGCDIKYGWPNDQMVYGYKHLTSVALGKIDGMHTYCTK